MKSVVYGTRDVPLESAALPKQIKHWFAEFGIRFDPASGTGYGRRRSLTEGCSERYRHFRALPHCGILQICDGDLDRWANSVGAEVELPKTRRDFRRAMARLLAEAKLCRVPMSDRIRHAAELVDRRDSNLTALEERYGDVVDWVKRYGPCYRSDRKVMHYYTRIKEKEARARAIALRHFHWLAPGENYRKYLKSDLAQAA